MLLIVFLFAFSQEANAQEPPPRPVDVTVIQDLGFGAFTFGLAGGTVTINSAGSRSSTGDVILLFLGYSFTSARYELVANPGTLISLLHDPSGFVLTGSLGGTMTLHTGDTNPISPFVITTVPPASTLLYIGGILTVGNLASNPPGNYSGSFEITFIQE